ncbi:hypothetical protein JOF56_006940 [Kibdelosporangium banguiense]|uniref:DUF4386 domain-containing protein n=1 Tax=Kibdelosporangium banguiense TaxID=1365924 RepID=A0ABS4TRI1_9PSEU|nr:DUF4386 domain-containing protein [Kibdelosporangium banguiense]MBP2326555.1 hypothetical protein [Kibdelosporangium banguiense]
MTTLALPVRNAGLVAGIGLLSMSVLAGFANFGVIDAVTTPQDAATTSFRAGVFALVLVVVLDVLVAWALLEFFTPVHRALAMLAAWFRLAYSAVFLVAIAHLFDAIDDPQALARIEAFRGVWDAGLILFGVHLLLIGCLAHKSGNVPTVLGVLLAIAGLGYVVDGAGTVLVADYSADIATFTFVGEVLFMLWLLAKARNTAT